MASSEPIISLPKGGGALQGLGEKFSPDLHTGTGNFTIPISVPPGRNGFQPQLNLVYSTGNGNGPFGLGWGLSIPGVTRKTSKGIPRYRDNAADWKDRDVFVLSGAEDLVELGPVADEAGKSAMQYRPRTEGLFAEILRYRNPLDRSDYWRVRSKDGFVSYYGTHPGAGEHPEYPPGADRDPAIVARPGGADDVFRWSLTLTKDTFGNRIEYLYDSDSGEENRRRWKQPMLKRIRYADYGDRANPIFLVTVTFDYESRPDAFSDHRAGFEIRTTQRCKSILIETHAERDHKVRRYEFEYAGSGLGGLSLLTRVNVVGFDDAGTEARELPPLDLGYSGFDPRDQKRRDFYPLRGELPSTSLANPNLELVDLFGTGMPDILEMSGGVRYWRNRGNGRFDMPRPMPNAPAGLSLADAGVQLIDADGDGRTDLLVTTPGLSGYFPLRFGGRWDEGSMRKHAVAPSFSMEDPEVRLIDLTGDGVTDVLRSGARFECFFNDPDEGWRETRWIERKALDAFPNVNFSDPRVKLGDMSGDGLQDIALVHDGNVEYWANLAYGNWSRRNAMRNSPRFPFGYDPRRILVGDIDGDGLADIVYVDDRKIRLWINQSGQSFSDEVIIPGTPPVSDMDSVRLTDLLGSGVSGILWSKDATSPRQEHYFFLDLTGGTKPYVLNAMDNNMGAVTKVAYAPSTSFYIADEKHEKARWKTPLPFPVQVVSQVEVIDELSQGKLTTEYRYHDGYWDGLEREFRGFGLVEQLDSESFDKYDSSGLHGITAAITKIDRQYFSAPTLTKTWFHQGAVEDADGAWNERDPGREYWQGDPHLLDHGGGVRRSLSALSRRYAGLPSRERRRIERDALRTLRGSVLRSELYALDGSSRERRPYTVTESACDVREEAPAAEAGSGRSRIFFPHVTAQRTSQWERGDDPLTTFTFTGGYDASGQALSQSVLAMPRRSARRVALPDGGIADETRILAMHTRTRYAAPEQGSSIRDRVALQTGFTLRNAPAVAETNPADVNAVLRDHYAAALGTHQAFERTLVAWTPATAVPAGYGMVAHAVNQYDGTAFVGLAPGVLGRYGALTRSESLILTDEVLSEAYGTAAPITAAGRLARTNGVPANFDDELGYQRRASPDHVTGLYAAGKQQQFDFQTGGGTTARGLLRTTRNALNQQTDIAFDAYDLLPVSATDAVGLSTRASYNYRVFQPSLVTSANNNSTKGEFSPLGMATAIWILGKENRTEGDRTRPSTRLEYDFRTVYRAKQAGGARLSPAYVRTIRQTHHDTDPEDTGEVTEAREYSDGFGRMLQVRMQGDDLTFGGAILGGGPSLLPIDQGDPGTQDIAGVRNTDAQNPNVIVSGWQRYDNKGRVVEKYEPFFAGGWAFVPPAGNELGQKSRTYYDPRGETVRVANPDGSEQRIIRGTPGNSENAADPDTVRPSSWEVWTYDANDNARLTHPAASTAYRHHWNTPNSALMDALGRITMAVERTRDKPATSTDPLLPARDHVTISTYDIQGNLLSVTDPLARRAVQHVYDLVQRPLRSENIDSGTKLFVLNALGGEVARRDGKGALTLRLYDPLNRPRELRARNSAAQPLTLRERLIYGDGSDRNQPQAARNANRDNNQLRALYRYFDEAGVTTCAAYDFKGNLIEKERKVISDQAVLDGLTPRPGGVETFTADWDIDLQLDDANPFETSTRFDALSRVTRVTYPRDTEGGRRVLVSRYGKSGKLESVSLDGAAYISRIGYDAKHQRVLIAYGNNVMTRYAYDARTFRVKRLRSERFTQPNGDTYRRQGAVLQDYAYAYDLAGNVLAIREQVSGCGVQGSADGRDALTRAFEYDPLYRLTRATGRESDDIADPRPWDDAQRRGFNSGNHGTPTQDNAPNLTRLYWETYDYDPAGNMMSMSHGSGTTGAASWVRRFGMSGFRPQEWRAKVTQLLVGGTPDWGAGGNRSTNIGGDTQGTTHAFDGNGNLVQEFNNRRFAWDHLDRLIGFADRPGGAAAATKDGIYLYDPTGQRVKAIARYGATNETTVYIDGIFEHHRRSAAAGDANNNSLHVMDDNSRIALIRVGAAFPDDGGPAVKYCLGDHLGCSAVIVGGADVASDGFINREEFFAFGETSFGSFGRKRYRFTGMERDEASGLNYHAARYYAPGLARWISADPLASQFPNKTSYGYVSNNPLRLVDPTGKADEKAASTPRLVKNASGSQMEWIKEGKSSEPARRSANILLGDAEKQFVVWELGKQCYGAADEAVAKLTGEPLLKGTFLNPNDSNDPFFPPRLEVYWHKYIDQNNTATLYFDSDRTQEVLGYIKEKIDQGVPVLVGVNKMNVGVKFNDKVTGHYIVILGYTEVQRKDGSWAVQTLNGMDNAIGLSREDPLTWPVFEVRKDGAISRNVLDTERVPINDVFDAITQVRVYKKDFEQVKKFQAWYGPKDKLVPVPPPEKKK